MRNDALINNYGILEVHLRADQSIETMTAVSKQILPLVAKLQSDHRKLNVLVELTQVGKVTVQSNKVAMEILDILPYDKVAVVGGSDQIKKIAKLLVDLAGRNESVKIFERQEDAVAWLYENLAAQAGS